MSDEELIDGVLADDSNAKAAFAQRAMPIFHRTAARLLRTMRRHATDYTLRQHLDDLIQELFRELFQQRVAFLKNWKAARGDLDQYLAVFARSRALSILRTRRRTPWLWIDLATAQQELLVHQIELASTATATAPIDHTVAARQTLDRLCLAIAEKLSLEEKDLMERLFWLEQDTVEITAELGISRAALHQRSYRLRQKLLGLTTDFELAGHIARSVR